MNIFLGRSVDKDHMLRRIKDEFLEMPGQRLTIQQAQRLWAIDVVTCRALFDKLVESRFLKRTHNGTYVRADSGEPARVLSAHAE